MKKILQQEGENRVLRKNTKDIPIGEITSLKIQKILKEMSEALAGQDDGVALAAPQIGYLLSIFIVSGKIFNPNFLYGEIETYEKKEKQSDLVFINPKILKLSREKEWVPEGCLSIRWLYGMVRRSKKATLTAYDETGKKFTRGASGLLAQIFQHETDHLKGALFIDQAREIKNEPPKG